MRGWPRWLGAGCALLAVTALPSGAVARADAEVRYTQKQTFSAALRYLRVDLAYEVVEKDAEAAYLLFELEGTGKEKSPARGSIEVVQTDASVRVFVSLPQLPSYREEQLKRGLLRKLRAEYGQPPGRAPRPKPDEQPEDESRQAPPSTRQERGAAPAPH